MRIPRHHPWNQTPAEAVRLQKELARRVILAPPNPSMRFIAGADIAVDPERGIGWAGVIVYELPNLVEVERHHARGKIRFPYVSGLLAFREIPLLLKAFAKLKTVPDCILVDGQGIAHPRRFGMASHLGVILNIPTIGCAKSWLIGTFDEPGPLRAEYSLLRAGNDVVGAVVRTRNRVKPVFVSPGHKVDIGHSVDVVVACCDGYRIPKPTREADRYVKKLAS